MAPSVADICVKLGYPRFTDKDYEVWVSNFKRARLRKQHMGLIGGPVALEAEEKILKWEAGIRKMYTDFPTHRALANLANQADLWKCARQLQILQGKKVRSDISEEVKPAAAQAVAKRDKRRTGPTATRASPASPASPRTATAPLDYRKPEDIQKPRGYQESRNCNSPRDYQNPQDPHKPSGYQEPPSY